MGVLNPAFSHTLPNGGHNVKKTAGLSKAEYRRQCIIRSPQFRKDLLQLHQQFPKLLVQKKNASVTNHAHTHVLDFFSDKGNGIWKANPKTLTDVVTMHSTEITLLARQQRFSVVTPENGEAYFKLLGCPEQKYLQSIKSLMDRWPEVGGEVFETGNLKKDAYHISLIVPDLPFDAGQWQAKVSRVAQKAKIMIPVYPDTREGDIDWSLITRLKAFLYEKPRARIREDTLALRLRVWDEYQEYRSFSAVSKQLRLPKTTVQRHYNAAHKDITGTKPQGKIKERRVSTLEKETHVQECARCQKATTVEQMCPSGQAFTKQDSVALRERLQ